ncbi:malto-oligosyltrehalose trehalohydrolase [Blastococcus sp. Marseille-P5729]|uniref:malto-oligosyltrehalose trehalohydrolase n=1 Tax=Blastococcus sp. Marseille-P5729 TaxID=2086582 RepID=UPI000D0E37EC|nr:malto-oligosyltrehalose trehalohydrolase [Blastococcus sp. Marseille-P5729]
MERYEVWAPAASTMRLLVDDDVIEMEPSDEGWWCADGPRGDYGYQIDGDDSVLPDPRSRWQPDGVHGRSRFFDTQAFQWSDAGWRGRSIEGGVIYELHVGAFTPEGTFEAAAGRLDHLLAIGVTHVELMPVNAFNGDYNWGYDGVLWYAVHERYGGPAAYQEFVDICHAKGLAVIQDVVHNHLGPSGNYLPRFGPYLASEGRSAWGEHVNLTELAVRDYILDNMAYWFEQMHVDGLRLDAVHALRDLGGKHLLQEMAERRTQLEETTGRALELIAESDLNDPVMITPIDHGGYGLDAQWSDDFHHALHVALTGEVDGYYADFASLSSLATVLEHGFFHAGSYSSFRGREHGHPIDTDRTPAWRLVVSAQNHDQIGNRARGDRITEVLGESELLIAALMLYAGPFTPMLFMGEEWAAATPFQFFTSHPEPELCRAVADGRRGEFARMGWDLSVVPDPQHPGTYEASHLDWTEPGQRPNKRVLDGYRRLAELRVSVAALIDPAFATGHVEVDDERQRLRFTRGAGLDRPAEVIVNFGADPWEIGVSADAELLFSTDAGVRLVGGALTLPPRSGALLLHAP